MTEVITAAESLERLKNPEQSSNGFLDESLQLQMRFSKAQAVERGDQDEAFLFWTAQTISAIQLEFFEAFQKLKAAQFYEAWCQFEHCEIAVNSLQQHHTVTEADPHRIRYNEKMVQRWQALYPYRVFASPEFVKKKVLCGICGGVVTPRSDCGHRKGKIYNGEMCYHKVVESEFLSIALVENPVQRYSVAFISNEHGEKTDQYNYANLKFAIDRLTSPWHEWSTENTTRRIPSSSLTQLASEVACPCGSGASYSDCCSGKPTLVVPHLQFNFSVAPPSHLPVNELRV